MGVFKRWGSYLTFHSLADYLMIVVELLTVVIIVVHLELVDMIIIELYKVNHIRSEFKHYE